MKVERIGKTNHAPGIGVGSEFTLCGLITEGDNMLKLPNSIQTNGKIKCKKCLEIIFYCVNLNKQIIKENK